MKNLKKSLFPENRDNWYYENENVSININFNILHNISMRRSLFINLNLSKNGKINY